MNKDFAKKRRRRYGKALALEPVSRLPTWLWMLLGIGLGVSLSALVYWKTHEKTSLTTHPVTMVMEDTKGNVQSKTLAKKRTETDGTRFDFYTLLPNNMAHDTLETVATTTDTPTLQQALTTPQNEASPFTYTLQAGSFRHLHQAEELKARLALLGFKVSIQTYKLNGKEPWHRVTMGPYKTKEEATKLQQKLEQAEAVHSLLIKNHV